MPTVWEGEGVLHFYEKLLFPALQKHRGKKRRYTIFEDNDPTGYKSGKAQTMKRDEGIVAHVFPREAVWFRLVWMLSLIHI